MVDDQMIPTESATLFGGVGQLPQLSPAILEIMKIDLPKKNYCTQDLDSLASGLSSCLTWLDMSRSKPLRRGRIRRMSPLVIQEFPMENG